MSGAHALTGRPEPAAGLYGRLMRHAAGLPNDDLFARMLASRAGGGGALPPGLGLRGDEFAALLARHFPHVGPLGLPPPLLDDGRQPEALAPPLFLRGIVVDVPPYFQHVLQQAEGHGVVHGGLQFQQDVEYYFATFCLQLVDNVCFFLAEVLQDVGLFHPHQAVFVYVFCPFFPDKGLEQLQKGPLAGEKLSVSSVVGVVGLSFFWHRHNPPVAVLYHIGREIDMGRG